MKNLKLKNFYLLIIGLLCCQLTLQAQTPELVGWSSQEPMAMSKNQCYNMALKALQTSGLSNIKTLDEWTASASNYNIRAGIACTTCENGAMASVAVAATHEYAGAKEMRDYLKDYMLGGSTPAVNASYRNINGTWICNYKCPAGGVGSTASFQQNGSELVFYNEGGQRFTGYFKDRNTIAVHGSSITSIVSEDGKKITWSNGTIWIGNDSSA